MTPYAFGRSTTSNELSTAALNQAIVRALADLSEKDIAGNLVIIEPGRIRIRRKT